jgi:hypothetical protein
MTRSGASAARMADRFYLVSLGGLLLTGYLALIGSGYLNASQGALGLACLLGAVGVLVSKLRRGHGLVIVLACLELTAAAVLSASSTFFLYLAVFLFFLVAALTAGEVGILVDSLIVSRYSYHI